MRSISRIVAGILPLLLVTVLASSLTFTMKIVVPAILLTAILSGCETTKGWSATGGSRADGVVRLSYEVGPFEIPRLDEQAGTNLATQRCKVWGYSGAEAFGGVVRQCNMPGGMGGCNRWLVTKEYQCTGNSTPPPNQ